MAADPDIVAAAAEEAALDASLAAAEAAAATVQPGRLVRELERNIPLRFSFKPPAPSRSARCQGLHG